MSNLATYGAVKEQSFDDMVTAHAPLVKRIAYHLMNRLPPSVQVEDLIQAGMIGLIEASRNYDPSQGASFETYAGIRIRGAMLDELRTMDWVPRLVRSKASKLAEAQDILFLGRGQMYPLAMEGALKLKEISYIHAEGYASGELKHGPIALIDRNVPVIVMAPQDALFDKTVSNMQEVMARAGKIVLVTDRKGAAAASEGAWRVIEMPETPDLVAPLVYAIPAQLLAYYTAVAKGTDVDQPRNLAKSVTVE